MGLLMILGLWTSVALIAGSLLMLALQIGTCLAQNWDVAGAQLIYVLLYFILLTYSERNRWSVDRYWKAQQGTTKDKYVGWELTAKFSKSYTMSVAVNLEGDYGKSRECASGASC